MNNYSKLLAEYLEKHFVEIDRYQHFEGMNTVPTLDQLLNLEALVKMAIEAKLQSI
jgi:hypothetical protein